MNTYCIFCKGGREAAILTKLKAMGLESFSPFARQLILTREDRTTQMKRLLPGYIFIECETEPDWDMILRIPEVYHRLQYQDGEYALRQSDLTFVNWLKHYEGVIEVSTAIQIGTRLHFLDGPLKSLEGQICKVNKKRNVAAVRFGDGESLLGMIWCSMEVIAKYADISEADELASPVSR